MTSYNDPVSSDISSLFAVEDEYLLRAREDSPKYGLPEINIKPEEGRFLQFLTFASGTTKAVEIGTLGGYSGIWIARGLHPGGKLITIEKEAKHANVAQEHFEAAGLSKVIDVRIGNAHRILTELRDEGPFDFVFINADGPGYPAYFDWAIENLHTRGIIAAHNPFRKDTGDVVGKDEDSELMRLFNQQVADKSLFTSIIFPAGDGTLISVKND
jgi:caffeoyl-CoA O-methyltransferase